MARTKGFFGNKCPYCGDKVYKTYGRFGMVVAKCERCNKRAKKMKEHGMTEKEIIKIFNKNLRLNSFVTSI